MAGGPIPGVHYGSALPNRVPGGPIPGVVYPNTNPRQTFTINQDPQTSLNEELANYQKIAPGASAWALQQQPRDASGMDTPAEAIQRQGLADAGARFGSRASLDRIKSLQTILGLPLTGPDQIPAPTTTPTPSK